MQQFQPQQQIGQYIVQSQLGKGSFGTVFKASLKKYKQTSNNPVFYAIKTQTINSIKPMLHLEYQIFDAIKSNTNNLTGHSFPQVYQFKQDDYMSYLVMELLDTTFQDFANNYMKNIFSKDCLIRIFYNILKIVQRIHKIGYIHRDIKPSNFMLKKIQNSKIKQGNQVQSSLKYAPIIYPIDLGLCKKYINPLTNEHIKCKENKKMVGTPIFCSLNTHEGLQQSRRDDIQSIIYMVTYLVKKLPWQKVCNKFDINQNNLSKNLPKEAQSPTKKNQNQKSKLQMYDQIYKIKLATNFQQFFTDQILPTSLIPIFKHIKKLQFHQQPHYDYIYGLLEKQHYQLTKKILDKQNCLCFWTNQQIKSIKIKEENKDQIKPKKIKINFKIPDHKLKKNKQIIQDSINLKSELEQNGPRIDN